MVLLRTIRRLGAAKGAELPAGAQDRNRTFLWAEGTCRTLRWFSGQRKRERQGWKKEAAEAAGHWNPWKSCLSSTCEPSFDLKTEISMKI